MAIRTLGAKVSRALDFFNKSNIHFAIGKSTPWEDDQNPPAPSLDSTMEEVIGYSKVGRKFVVIPYDGRQLGANDILIDYTNSTQWLVIPHTNALLEGAYHVYIETTIEPDDLPQGEYRQVGIYTGLQVAQGVSSGKEKLLPSEVADPGILEIIDFRQPSTRQATTREQLSFVIGF